MSSSSRRRRRKRESSLKTTGRGMLKRMMTSTGMSMEVKVTAQMMMSREGMPDTRLILRWQRLRETISSGHKSKRAADGRELSRPSLGTSHLMKETLGHRKSPHRTMLIEITPRKRGSME